MAPFKRRERKHRVRRRTSEHPDNGTDTNASEILPASQQELKSRREEMRASLRAEQPKMSSKKQKRLDKYIVGFLPNIWTGF